MKRTWLPFLISLTMPLPFAQATEAPTDHSFTSEQADPGQTYSPNRANVAVYDPNVASNGELLVFLSGTGAAPKMYNRVLRSAVEVGGYHSLGLDWANGFDTSGEKGSNIFGPCAEDGACFTQVRLEAFDGVDHTPKITIGKNDGILNRLIKALTYLDKTYPSEGWGAFLVDGQPAWSKIVLGGHSNGSGEAAFIASRIRVARVVMYSGPVEATGTAPPFTAAPWTTSHPATPASVWYAFASTKDNAGALDRIDRDTVTWKAFGLLPGGKPAVVDNASPPYGGAHALVTNLKPCAGCTPHNMTAGDKTPLDNNNVAVFRPVWLYMLGIAPDGQAAAPPAATNIKPAAVQVTPAGPVASTAGEDIALPTPQIVHYDSDGVSLKAFLYLPAGAGPFAVYLWNHGSEANPSQDRKLAQFWLGQGFAFFKPIRGGHGGNPGGYIVDGEKAIFAQETAGTLKRNAANAAILALHERANEDVINAYKWLIAQPFADKQRIVVGGGSYGGIQTLLTAEQNARQSLGIAAFVTMSPAAESWRPAWSQDLAGAIRAAKGPIFLMQARNDYNLGPTRELGPLVEARGAPSTCLLFPEHIGGAVLQSDDPHAQGHAGFFADPSAWGGAVIDFLKASGVVAASAAGPSAGSGPTPCGPGE